MTTRILKLNLAILTSFNLFFIHSSYANSSDTSDCQKVANLQREFQQRPKPRLLFMDPVSKERGFQKYIGEVAVKIDFNLEKKEVPVEFLFFKSLTSKQGNHSTLVLLPGLFGTTFLDEHIAMYYANKGINVIVTHYRDIAAEFSINGKHSIWTNNMVATKGVIDALLEARPELDSTRLGLMGYSFGGVRAAFLAALDQRFKAVNILVGSGSVSDTLAYSNKDFITKLRSKHMKDLGLESAKEYASFIRSKMPFEPINAICLPDYSHYYIVISKQDEWIPSALQEQFQAKLPGSKVTVYDTDHVSSVLNFSMINLRKSLAFFKSHGI